jgi:DNA primase
VASCGTALTPQQVQQLHRFASKVVLSFDSDAAGQGATAKSCELFVAEGFDINVAELPAGQDPDAFIRMHGGAGYGERLKHSKPYLEYLLDRVAMVHNLRTPEGKARFVDEVLPIVGRIPDRTRQELSVKEVSSRASVSEDAIWPRTKKAITQHSARISHSQLPALGDVTKAEKAVIWCLVHEPDTALTALAELESSDFDGLASRSVLDLARRLNDNRSFSPSVLLERLNMVEAQLVTAIASEPEPPALSLGSCVRELRRGRYEKERAAVQRAIAQLQTRGAATGGELDALLVRKGDLGRLIQALVIAED